MLFKIIIFYLITFLINIPFGFLRSKVKKLSFLWFVYIHTPVIFIIVFRKLIEVKTFWWVYVIEIIFFFAGQRFGGFLNKQKNKSCLLNK